MIVQQKLTHCVIFCFFNSVFCCLLHKKESMPINECTIERVLARTTSLKRMTSEKAECQFTLFVRNKRRDDCSNRFNEMKFHK